MFNRFKLGLRGKTTIALGGLIFLALSASSTSSYWQSKKVAEQKVIELEQSKFVVLQHEIESSLSHHHKNLLSLHDVPPVQAIFRAMAHQGLDPESGDSREEWDARLKTIFTAFLSNQPEYLQLRLLDAAGNELVRVQTNSNGEVIASADSALQNKASSLYVSETLKLKAGQTYYSDVTLNREHGIIQQPHVPVLRLASPVHNADGEVVGLIVINLSTDRLFSGVKSDGRGVQRNIANEQGYYIKHIDADKTFGLERGLSYTIQDAEPGLAKLVKTTDYTIRRDIEHKELNGFQKIYFSPQDHSRYWLLMLHMPEQVVFAEIATALDEMLLTSFGIGLFALLLILWYVSRKFLSPIVILAESAKQLQKGNLSVRVDESKVSDEFQTLYIAINAFAENQKQSTLLLEKEVDLQTKRLSAVIDNIVDGIITIGERGTIESFNPAARRIFGYENKEVIGKNVKMLMPEPYQSQHDGYLDHHLRTGEKKVIGIGREVTGRRKDDSTFPMELAVSEVKIEGVRHFVGIVRDITERKVFEQKIVDEKKQLSAVIDNVVDGIITIGERGSIESFNPAARRIFGYNDDEVIGQNVKMLMPEPYHSEHDGYLHNHITTGEKKVIGIGREVTGRRKDGSTFPMELAVSEVVIDGVRHFVGITRDITERKRVEQMQKEFISTVSHELRTPLTSIRGSLGLILGGVTGELPEKAKALLTIANNNSERLIHLINDILDMEKVAAGEMQFDYALVNLTSVVQQAIESNEGYGDELKVSFKLVEVPEEQVIVRIDEKRTAQVMSNLMSNAAKYSPTDDTVEISVSVSGKLVRISVHDHGKGIPEEFKSRIFSKFAQADSSDTRQKGGTGLGLNITKAIVEQQGGSIGFESLAGEGTTFSVDLPLWVEETAVQEPEAETEEIEQIQTEKNDAKPQAYKARILIVEDDRDVSKLLSMMMENAGYSFHQAYDFADAVQHLKNNTYAAITLDLMIPGGSGLSLLRQLRHDKATSELPVIVVSAKARDGKLEVEGEAISMVNWIEKPINQKKLLKSIRAGISSQTTSGSCVLHVEDDPDIAMIVDSLLGDVCQVVHAETLQLAKDLLSKQKFDLVLLDIGLPDGSGLDLLPMLNRDEQQTPVIIFSAQDVSPEVSVQVRATLMKSKTDNSKLMQQIKLAIQKNDAKRGE